MAERSKFLENIPVLNNIHKNVISIDMFYADGGMNYFSGKNVKRGYYISFMPMQKYENYSASYLFSGSCILVEEAKRFSAKRFGILIANYEREKYEDLIQKLAKKEKLEIAELT